MSYCRCNRTERITVLPHIVHDPNASAKYLVQCMDCKRVFVRYEQ